MQRTSNHTSRTIYSISEITQRIKSLLEKNYAIIWLSGEISNIRIPASGHAYFNLKDEKAQISAVMFKGQLRNLKFKLEDGATIIGLGRITVYEPRGTYQVILEYVEPHGVGALQIAFEQLKRTLKDEGLFDTAQKNALPFLPTRIGVITSPSGAVIQDIIQVINRRYPGMPIDIVPVRVQGEQAVDEIVEAISLANTSSDCDLIILARGGGSFEDMAAFNSEAVARAIFASQKPIVSAVGHETDISIADFVADLRAPTPSAAAEIAVPVQQELKARCLELSERCRSALKRTLTVQRNRLEGLARSMHQFKRGFQDQFLRLDDLSERLLRAGRYYFHRQREYFDKININLFNNKPDRYIEICKAKHELMLHRLNHGTQMTIARNRQQLNTLKTALNALNPNAVLRRGYSITRKLPHRSIISDANQVHLDDRLDIQLALGSLVVKVLKKSNTNQ